MNKKHKKGTYWLDLADNGYWLIKNEAGYREHVGVGDEGKKAALEKIERLNKGEKIELTREDEIGRWRDMVEIYCAAIEEFLNELANQRNDEPREIAEIIHRKLQGRLDNLREKCGKEE